MLFLSVDRMTKSSLKELGKHSPLSKQNSHIIALMRNEQKNKCLAIFNNHDCSKDREENSLDPFHS